MKPTSYIELKKYFENLVENSNFLNSFVGYFSRELHNKQTSYDGIKAPFLCLFGYGIELEHNDYSSQAVRNINFGILFNNIPAGNYEEQYQAIDDAERLAFRVIARVRMDNNNEEHFLYRTFINNSLEVTPIELDGDGLFGVEVSFKLSNVQSLMVSPDDWKDIEKVC